MKKILFAIIFILMATASWSWAETCIFDNAGADGAWHTAANWDCGAGHTEKVPVADDDVQLAASVTWAVGSGARIPATSGRLGAITSSGAYGISVDAGAGSTCDADGACGIYFTTATANTEILLTATGSGTCYLTVDGTSVTASSGTSGKHGLYHNSSCYMNVVMSGSPGLIGSSGSTGAGLKTNAAGGALVKANISSASSAGGIGISHGGSALSVLTIGDGSTSYTITGSDNSATSPGLMCNSSDGAADCILTAGVKLVNGTKSSAVHGAFTWNAAATDYWTIAGTGVRFAKEVAAGDLKDGVWNGQVEGTLESGGGQSAHAF